MLRAVRMKSQRLSATEVPFFAGGFRQILLEKPGAEIAFSDEKARSRVSGLTISSASRQLDQTREKATQKSRSLLLICGRRWPRFKTRSC